LNQFVTEKALALQLRWQAWTLAARSARPRVLRLQSQLARHRSAALALALVVAWATPAHAVSAVQGNPVVTWVFWLTNVAGAIAFGWLAIKTYIAWTDLDNQGENIWKLVIAWGGLGLTWVGILYYLKQAAGTSGQQLQGLTDMGNMR
jgi:hypothetical protein